MADFYEKALRAAQFYWENNGIFNRFEGVPDTLVRRMVSVYAVLDEMQHSVGTALPEIAARTFVRLGGGNPDKRHGTPPMPMWRWAEAGVSRALEAGWPDLMVNTAWSGAETKVEYMITRADDADVYTVVAYGPNGSVRAISPFTDAEAERFVAAMR